MTSFIVCHDSQSPLTPVTNVDAFFFTFIWISSFYIILYLYVSDFTLVLLQSDLNANNKKQGKRLYYRVMSSSPEKVRVAHLLIKHTGSRNPISRRTNGTITLSPEMAMEELQQYEQNILQQLHDNNNTGKDLGTIFSQYAYERSDCSSYQNGGDLGEFTRGQMQQPFEDTSFTIQPGQMSTIVSTDSGYHLIYRIS
jgi:parvulin-like peptidyl-prolyl isomerase